MDESLLYIATGIPLGFVILYAFWLYCRNEAEICFGTWFILAYGDILDSGTYLGITEKWWTNIVPACFALGSIAVFAWAFLKSRFGRITKVDVFCILADVLITIFWGYSLAAEITDFGWLGQAIGTSNGSAIANLAYQASSVIAFVPLFLSQISGSKLESPIPWCLWTFACAGFAGVVVLEYQSWEQLAYPFVNLITHGLIAAVALAAVLKCRAFYPRRA